jgi:hypothetical protein
MAYTITFPTAHPSGANFAVIATPQTSNSTFWDANYYFICTSNVESLGTGFTVWCRKPGFAQDVASGFVHGSFYVYTIP